MILARKLMMATASPPRGQMIYTIPGTYNFIVPAGVYSICCAVVGAGGGGMQIGYGGAAGGGGACAWTNNVSVTPGQTVEIVVGAGNPNFESDGSGISAMSYIGGQIVLARPGRAASPTIAPGVYNNGAGGLADTSTGANRYSGADGNGNRGGSAAGLNGTLPAPLAGRGGTGVNFSNTSWSTNQASGSTLTQLYGAAAGGGGGGAGGSGINVTYGADGAAIIIWGPGRGFSLSSNNY